jgi:Flp pilus assembly protein TadG
MTVPETPGTARTFLSRLRREEGQALVEFALVLPVLLMIVTGITSFGIVFYRYVTLTDAVRVGARTLALQRGNSSPCTSAANQTVASAVDVGLTNSQLTFSYNGTPFYVSSTCSGSGATWNQGDSVTVQATIPYSLSIFGVITITSGHLTAQATDAVE